MASTAAPRVPPSVLAFARRLSPRAQAAVETWQWHLDEAKRFPREEMVRRLLQKGVPEWPFLWPLEEAFAGTTVRLGGFDLELGIAENVASFDREELVDEHDQIRFVPVGYWGIYTVFLDATGRMFLFHVPDELVPIEPSFESFIEQQAMMSSFRTWAPNGFVADLSPSTVAPLLATERATPPVAEASNEFHRWWQDEAWTLFQSGQDGIATIWARTLEGLVAAIDAAARIEPRFAVRPRPSYEKEHIEELATEEIAARAPTPESLRDRAGARRVALLGQPSIYEGKPPSTGDVWLSGEGEALQIDVLERREGKVVNYWQLTPTGSHALLMSTYGKG